MLLLPRKVQLVVILANSRSKELEHPAGTSEIDDLRASCQNAIP